MRYRISGVVVLFSIGLGVTSVTHFKTLWPMLPVSIATGTVILIFASYYLGSSVAWLMGACGLLFSHTLIALFYPETLSVIDPDSYAVWANQIINSGSISQAETGTYSTLPAFLLLISAVSEVTGLAPRNAFICVPMLISIIIPLFTAWFTASLTGRGYTDWPAAPAALISSTLTMTVVSGYRPIAMTLGYLLMLLAFIVSIRYYIWKNNSDMLAFVVLAFGIMLSHHFIILLLALAVGTQWAVLITLRSPRQITNSITLPIIAGTFLIFQWMYMTTSLSVAVHHLTEIFAESGLGVGVGELQTSASKPVIESRILGIVSRRAHALILIPIAGISWIYFASIEYTRLRYSVLLALATAAVLGVFLPISVAFPTQLRYTRSVAIAEPVLLALAIGCGWLLWRRPETRSATISTARHAVILFFAVALIAAQVGSAPVSADHPANYRGYLKSDEVTAKMWGHQYAGTNISADPFFAHEKPSPEAYVNPTGRIKQNYRNRYQTELEMYTNQSISAKCPKAILFREIKIYRSPKAQVLQWDPEPTLNAEYARSYDSGKVQFYQTPRCR